jgi:crotonobetainyl-CoA:carnitine CoA-transferase CaiB-like acyl-CoA transferase
MKGALEGVKVLDFTQMMMGPWATQFLGDLGAEVVKVERPGAGEWERGLQAMGTLLDGQSPFFLAMNRNKQSLSLNLKDPRAREAVRRLVVECDLVVENFRPGVMDRLGLGYDDLRAVNPSIVYVSGSGFGPDGPYVDRPGQDLLIQAISGLAASGGRRDDPPMPSGSSIVDASTALLVALSSMVGLWHRAMTGEGQRIDVSLFNTAVALQCQELAAFLNMPERWERSEAGIAGAWLSAPFGIYRTTDGHVAIAMASLTVLAELLGEPDLAASDDDGRAYGERDTAYRLLAPHIARLSTHDVLRILETRDVWCAPVQGFDDLVEDPQLVHNDLITTVPHPTTGDDVRVVGMPVRFSATPGDVRSGPPAVGQHTDDILSRLGFTDEEIGAMHEDGVA